MKKVLIEKFIADYDEVVAKREEVITLKEKAIAEDNAKVDSIVRTMALSDNIKSVLIEAISKEKEQLFNTSELDKEIAFYEKYLVEEVEEEHNEKEESNL